MIHLFAGHETAEAIGFAVFCQSVYARASKPVSITALAASGLPTGSNAFTLSRFLVPHLMGYQGHAIFMDASDMLMLADVAELDALFDDRFAVQVVKHPNYETRNPVKYIGTPLECANRDYPRKNWASVMIFNCAHPDWRGDTPESLRLAEPLELLQFHAVADIGELPGEWNRLVDEGQPLAGAKVLHWTAGIPAFEHYRDAPGADLWRAELARMEAY